MCVCVCVRFQSSAMSLMYKSEFAAKLMTGHLFNSTHSFPVSLFYASAFAFFMGRGGAWDGSPSGLVFIE